MIKAIIFDFDGSMVDTESSAYDSWQEIYREHGCELPVERWASIIGGAGLEFDACDYLAEQTGRRLDREALIARRNVRKLQLLGDAPLLPGIAEMLEEGRRRGLKLGLASSSDRAWVFGHLNRLGVTPLLEAIVCAEDVRQVKPAPDLYLEAARRLGVLPSQALAIEDSLNGVRAAKAAGMACVAVPNAFLQNADFTIADLRLASLADLPPDELVGRFAGRR